MSEKYMPLRWGILGAGGIANRFSNDVKPLSDHRLIAVGSREQSKADAFADKFDIPNRHDSYEALCADPEVDVIYVATPHNFHKEHTLLALEQGKAVLCEKPFTIDRAEAQLVDDARARNLFLMEGMWSRCFPLWVKVREMLKAGEIGKPRMLIADFGFQAGQTNDQGVLEGYNPQGRLFDPALGGGALMDVGVYPVSLAQSLFGGTPDQIAGLATLGATGVDENTGMLMRYPGGEVAITSTSPPTTTPWTATILGSAGKIEVDSPWWTPKYATIHRNGKEKERLEMPYEGGSGFQFEAMHVADCLRAGKTESDIVTHADSLSVMYTLDTLRAQMGVKYPME